MLNGDLAKFFAKTFVILPSLLALATLGDTTQLRSTQFVLHQQRWQRQVQYSLLCLVVTVGFKKFLYVSTS
jgi:hypothetical protein